MYPNIMSPNVGTDMRYGNSSGNSPYLGGAGRLPMQYSNSPNVGTDMRYANSSGNSPYLGGAGNWISSYGGLGNTLRNAGNTGYRGY